MHIVAITGRFYPDIMAPSACIKPYLQELAKSNEVEVVCPISNSQYKRSVVEEGIRVRFITNPINNVLSWANTNIKEHKNYYISKCTSFLIRGIKYIKEKYTPVPYDTTIINSYYVELDQINSEKEIDVIISVTFPFYTHVVALKYKQKNPHIKWLSYTTDPLAYNEANPVPRWKKKNAIRIEQEVYDNCDCSIVTEELYNNVTCDYHINPQKVMALPYLIETENVPIQKEERKSERCQVLYAGFLFYRVRNPKKMLEVFSRIDSVDLRLYVSGDRICRKMLRQAYPSHIYINGLVPRDEYFKLIGQADILLNLSNDAKLQAPHKLTELISTGRPIINFYYYKDAGYRLIEKYPLGLNVYNNGSYDEIVDAIRLFLSKNSNKKLSAVEIQHNFQDYLLSNQIEKIKNVLYNE